MTNVHLLIENLCCEPRWGARLELPSGNVAFLVYLRNGEPKLVSQADEFAVALEVLPGSSVRVAMTSRGNRVKLNGKPAPPLMQLRPGDELELPDRHDLRLHVAAHHSSSVERANAELAGRECPVCRVPFAVGEWVYRCPCGTAVHGPVEGMNSAEWCAAPGGHCPDCTGPIALEAGYESLPEGCDAVLAVH